MASISISRGVLYTGMTMEMPSSPAPRFSRAFSRGSTSADTSPPRRRKRTKFGFSSTVRGDPGRNSPVPATRIMIFWPSSSMNRAPRSILNAHSPPASPASSRSPRNSLASAWPSTWPSASTASTTTGVLGSRRLTAQPCADVPWQLSK